MFEGYHGVPRSLSTSVYFDKKALCARANTFDAMSACNTRVKYYNADD